MADEPEVGKGNNPDVAVTAEPDDVAQLPDLPEKLQGKSAADIAAMYVELEKHATTASQKAKQFDELSNTLKPWENQIVDLINNGGVLSNKPTTANPAQPQGAGGSASDFLEKYGIEPEAVLSLVMPRMKEEFGGIMNQQLGPIVQKFQSDSDAELRARYGDENFIKLKTQGAAVLRSAGGLSHAEAMEIAANRLGIKPTKKANVSIPDNAVKTQQPSSKGGSDMSADDLSKSLMDRMTGVKAGHSILRPTGGSRKG